MTPHITTRRCTEDSSGSSLLESAIAISVLMTAIVGIFNFSLALYAAHYVANAAADGARYAMVRGAVWGTPCVTANSFSCTATNASVNTYLMAGLPLGVKKANTTIVATWPRKTASGGACYSVNGAASAGCSVNVAVTYTFNLSLPLLPKKQLQFSSSATMPITQ